MPTALTGEGAVYPHGWTGSGCDILVISAFPYGNCTVNASFSWVEL